MDIVIEWLDNIDKELFLFLNSLHFDWLDPIVFTSSGKLIWIPLYIFLIVLLFRKYKIYGLYYLLLAGIIILISDQVTSGLMKPFFERLRPSHNPEFGNIVHIVNDYRGGSYGFASSHAANTFSIAVFFNIIFKNKQFLWLIFWAAMVSYTRIYLGVHYPGDIIVGALIGIFAALLTVKTAHRIYNPETSLSQ